MKAGWTGVVLTWGAVAITKRRGVFRLSDEVVRRQRTSNRGNLYQQESVVNKLLKYGAMTVLVGAGLGVAHADDSSTKLGGKMYFDATHISDSTNGVRNSDQGNGFDVKRFYFSVDHKFDSIWSANLTTDFHYSSSDGKSDIFVKKAFVQGAFDPLFKLRAGSADMPWIPYVENLYGFRYVENTITDRFGIANSADWGVHALGKEGIFDYQVSVVSGAGYSHVSARTNSIDYALRAGVTPVKGLTVAAGFYSGKRGQNTATSPAANTQTRYDVVAGYVGNGLRLGGEFFSEKNPNNTAISTGPSDKATGYSLWGSYEVVKPVTIFARFDQAKLKKDTDSSLKNTYYNFGAQYAVRKGILVALVYKHFKNKDNTMNQKYNEIGVFSQIKF